MLVVDLDGTLCRTDTLHEALLALVARSPATLAYLPGWLAAGRAEFKARIAAVELLDPTMLPLDEVVVETLRAARAGGRRTALVSAADIRQVEAVAAATGLFDEVHGSAGGRNLKGPEKAAFLTERYGKKGFDYIGDARADLPVWTAARKAITVRAAPALRRAAETANTDTVHISPPQDRARAAVRAMRPHQWSKNLLLLLPPLAAHDPSGLPTALAGFVAFCLVASSVYVINDLFDLASDRAHPRKCRRSFASGALSGFDGLRLAVLLLTSGFVIGLLTTPRLFLLVLATYFAATLAYSLWLKRKLVVDVITLAGLYSIRLIAGGVAAAVVLSPWMLGFSMFLFLALAAVKRQAELTDQLTTGRMSAGRAYEPEDLPVLRGLALSAANAAVLVLALYISSNEVQTLYNRPEILWLICPILLYWLVRMVMKTHRGLMNDDPIVYATSDAVSMVLIAAAGVVAIASAVVPPS